MNFFCPPNDSKHAFHWSRAGVAILVVGLAMSSFPDLAAQSADSEPQAALAASAPSATQPRIDGKWTYRSFHNNPDLSTEFNKLKFSAGHLELVTHPNGSLSGSLGDTGWRLNLKGWYTLGTPPTVRFQGTGMISDELWIYDYMGFVTLNWPNGEEQRPAIVGTIVRTKAHSNGASKAGYVASWIAVLADD